MFTKEQTQKADTNNTKALAITKLAIMAFENGLDGIDVVETLEVIHDYLKSNDVIFDGCGV